MTDKLSMSQWTIRPVIFVLALIVAGCATMGYMGEGDVKFVAVESGGAKMWQSGGTIDLKTHGPKPLMLKVVNTLPADHGFSIDTMKVKEVIYPGEERMITVPLENIDPKVSDHLVYCQLHPKHVAARLTITGR